METMLRPHARSLRKHVPGILPASYRDVWSAAPQSTTLATWMWPWTAAMHHRTFLLPLTSLNHRPTTGHPIMRLTYASQRAIQENDIVEMTGLDCLYKNTLDINLDFIKYDRSDLSVLAIRPHQLSSEFHWFARRVSSFWHFVAFFREISLQSGSWKNTKCSWNRKCKNFEKK